MGRGGSKYLSGGKFESRRQTAALKRFRQMFAVVYTPNRTPAVVGSLAATGAGLKSAQEPGEYLRREGATKKLEENICPVRC